MFCVLIFMSATSENNKRIAKNMLFLYMRMLLIMGVTLYTSRVVLQVLGVEDFGIYNVVGGSSLDHGFFYLQFVQCLSALYEYRIRKARYSRGGICFSTEFYSNVPVVCYIITVR